MSNSDPNSQSVPGVPRRPSPRPDPDRSAAASGGPQRQTALTAKWRRRWSSTSVTSPSPTGSKKALADVNLRIYRNRITALIGPSGCGKTTFLRSLNRMNDPVPGFKIDGQILYHGHEIYGERVDRIEVRRRIGMVFQKPNPFPKSIYNNIAWAPAQPRLEGRPRRSRRARPARRGALGGGQGSAEGQRARPLRRQQQRLCIARAIAIEPDVLLLDEPASALDPVATAKIEELMHSLKSRYTIVIVTHNMQQAARVADQTAFFGLEMSGAERVGSLIECGDTETIFTQPADQRTRDYVTGRFG